MKTFINCSPKSEQTEPALFPQSTVTTCKSVPLPLSGRWAAGRCGRWVLETQTSTHKVTGSDWLSERERQRTRARLLSRLQNILRTAPLFRLYSSARHLTNIQQVASCLHSEEPWAGSPYRAAAAETTVLCMRWAIKAREEEKEDGSFFCLFFFPTHGELRAHRRLVSGGSDTLHWIAVTNRDFRCTN